MTDWLSIAREYFPASSDEDLQYILWNWTAFPLGDEEHIRGNLAQALRWMADGKAPDQEIHRMMEEAFDETE